MMRRILEKILQLPRGEEGELVPAYLVHFGFLDNEIGTTPDASTSSEKSRRAAEREARRYEVWDRMFF